MVLSLDVRIKLFLKKECSCVEGEVGSNIMYFMLYTEIKVAAALMPKHPISDLGGPEDQKGVEGLFYT